MEEVQVDKRGRLQGVKGSAHAPSSSSSLSPPSNHLILLCSFPGANELLMAAEPLINPPSISPHPYSSCPPVLPLQAPSSSWPPGRALCSLAPTLYCLSAHVWTLGPEYLHFHPSTPHQHPLLLLSLPLTTSLFLIIFLSPVSPCVLLALLPHLPFFYFLLSHSCSHDAAAAGAVAASINIVLMLWWLEPARW